jgi:hypothetical protein
MRTAFLAAALAVFFAAPTAAQGLAVDAAVRGIGQQDLAGTLRGALEIIHEAQCAPGRRCARARAEEFETPPLTPGHARLAARTGMASGFAESCGMDWEGRVFRPYIEALRNELKLNQRETALMTLMHGHWQNVFRRNARPEDCAPGGFRRAAVEQYGANPPPIVPLN